MRKSSKGYKFIANYDLNSDYSYSTFWKGREYEHFSEILLLQRLFSKYFANLESTGAILDLGGGHARLAEIYKDLFKECVLGDYSIHELNDGLKNLAKLEAKNFILVGMNAYKIPFKNNSFDAVLSVRMMHHIREPNLLFSEIYRILKPEGYFILEVANKHHIKSIVKNILRGNFKELKNNEIKEVEHNESTAQGIKDNQIPIMYNYSKETIIERAIFHNFQVVSMHPCSFFRSELLKQKLPLKLLLSLEKNLQRMEFLTITPSIFYVLKKPNLEELDLEQFKHKEGIKTQLCSPLDHSEINPDNFRTPEGIYDLREPRPEEVNF
mgnify:CR=1 FL=1